MPGNIKHVIIGGILIPLFMMMAGAIFVSCASKKNDSIPLPKIPYPDAKTAISIQAYVDSSQYLWFTDVKAMASSFCNDQLPAEKEMITVGDVTVLEESTFHAKAEVHLPQKTVILTMERAFKEKGTNSIWQIVAIEVKKE
jgi:hypothetical protein